MHSLQICIVKNGSFSIIVYNRLQNNISHLFTNKLRFRFASVDIYKNIFIMYCNVFVTYTNLKEEQQAEQSL